MTKKVDAGVGPRTNRWVAFHAHGFAWLALVSGLFWSTLALAVSPPEVLFTIPVGGDGLHYSGLAPEELPWGPSALKMDKAGTFWIADSADQRLLRFNAAGDFL